ncbi:sporulation integral membrane protein YlbJ [Bacillus sp. FJAT-42376]|uniref:sporulation integral membrane protein YlbJ n=1 Tax=Bacillus sp. FJAT-42376 TaxID=2014076 RepID=UPI000F4E1402|nr:sporulation integral membrane protein YlbJ [Bacillus sp. FJAT-42376]AZB42818.1 sporulation integral membrane protein YlbJ [Bacillus sp. FJAT-42376]
MSREKWHTLLIAGLLIALTASIILHPKASLEASRSGLEVWWTIVFPSLLPFFIVSELLIGFGIVRFAGVLLEPVMRPLFKVPGAGGFVWAMGIASGFPAGAKLTALLRKEKQLTQIEAERLVSFTNCSSPLFMFAAVSVGIFKNPALGLLLASAHYLSNLCVGIIMRFHGRRTEALQNQARRKNRFFPSVSEAFLALHETRLKNKKPIGKMLGDAVLGSVQTLLIIGGFIILFSVLNRMLDITGFSSAAAAALNHLFLLFSVPPTLTKPFLAGLFEITQGNMEMSKASAGLLFKIMLAGFILGFSGLSVQAQVASILAETDIRFLPFFIARIMQGFLAAFLTWLLWNPLYIGRGGVSETSVPPDSPPGLEAMNPLFAAGPAITLIFLVLYIWLYWRKTLRTV